MREYLGVDSVGPNTPPPVDDPGGFLSRAFWVASLDQEATCWVSQFKITWVVSLGLSC